MARSATCRSLLLLCIVGILICASSAQTCMPQNFTNKIFETCIDLPVLNAFLHWTYSPSNGTVDVAYWATPASAGDWVAWAINPTGQRMVGSQAIGLTDQSLPSCQEKECVEMIEARMLKGKKKNVLKVKELRTNKKKNV
ncbi:Auxin-induced in root cultures protein 12 [Nymphaea thermarum]|nr:Auxin-induced in root cultures protein 12 [Nymphaea thermarum]